MDIPVTYTKVILPNRRHDILTRPRLLDLFENILDTKLFIVVAPAGYGKTTLLLDFAHQVELPVCWLALDELDRDPQRFLSHFVASITEQFPAFGKQATAYLNSPGTSIDLNQFNTVIANEVYENIREHCLLVLDDYHIVQGEESINAFVNQFVQTVPENFHLILSSRQLLTLPDMPLLVARRQVGGLDYSDLSFRPEEVQSLAWENSHQTMSRSMAEELVGETEGWVTGLLLLTETLWNQKSEHLRIARTSNVSLYDYLAQQILDREPPPIRQVMLQTSLLEEFNAELCEAVLGAAPEGNNWENLIGTLLQKNLFLLPIDNRDLWVRYHHLMRDFLQAQLAREQPQETPRILRKLASVRMDRSEWEMAFAIYQRLEDPESTADLITRAEDTLAESGRISLLSQWLECLPRTILQARPSLISLHGIVNVMMGEVKRGLQILDQAIKILRSNGDKTSLAKALNRRAFAHQFLGDYSTSLEDVQETLTLVCAHDIQSSTQAEAQRIKGINLFRLGNVNDAIHHLESSRTFYVELEKRDLVALVDMDLGVVHRACGAMERAKEYYRQALAHWKERENLTQLANLLNNMGVLYHYEGDYLKAEGYLNEALECAQKIGYVRIETLALTSIGDLYADLEAYERAIEVYEQARIIARRLENRHLLLYIDMALAVIAITQDQKDEANNLIKSAQSYVQEGSSRYENSLYQSVLGRSQLAEGNYSEAVKLLEDAAHGFEEGGQVMEAAQCQLFHALALYQAGEIDPALVNLKKSYDLADSIENPHILVVVGRKIRPLLEFAKNNANLEGQTTQLIARIDRFEKGLSPIRKKLRQQASSVPFAPPKLIIRTLGKTQVLINGKPIKIPEWQSRKAVQELFFCLIAHPNGLTKEEIGLFFWPEATSFQLKNKFKNAIYRLRLVLGQEVVLFEDDFYQFNSAMDYEYDLETFHKLLGNAEESSDPKDRLLAYRKAIDVYKGPFLQNIDHAWVEPLREEHSQRFREAVFVTVEQLLSIGEPGEAMKFSRRILAEDPYQEEAHRLVMRAHALMGNKADIVRQFESCQRALDELSLTPSPETRSLYDKLIN